MKKMSRSKRGISPILATLLLVVIAVAAIVVTYAWVMTYMGGATSQAGVLLQVDNLYWNSTQPRSIEIYVRNTGTSDAEIDKVYIGNSNVNLEPQDFTSDVGPPYRVAREGGVITIIVEYNWTAGETYHFKIVPKMGNALDFSWKAPS